MEENDYIKCVLEKGISVYYAKNHRNIEHLVLDMESRGLPRALLQYYFGVVILSERVVEILGVKEGEVITNTVFENCEGKYSFFLDLDL